MMNGLLLITMSSPSPIFKSLVRLGFFLLLLYFLQSQTSAWAIRLPDETVCNLCSSKTISLPRLLQQGGLILAVGFHPDEQPAIEKGLADLLTLKKEAPGILILEVPVLDSKYRFFKSSIEPIMRRMVVDQTKCQYIFPLYSEVKEFRKQLGLNNKVKYAFIFISASGEVVWKETSPLTSAKLHSLKALIK